MQEFGAIEVIFSILVLIMSVVIHEVSHGLVALSLGDPTARLAGRLTLNPLKHLDPVGSFIVPLITSLVGFSFGWAKPVPYNPYNLKGGRWGPALVGAAGPLSNLFLAFFFGFFLKYAGIAQLSLPMLFITNQIIFINIILAVFNLIPLPPLDGSKILFAVLPYRFSYIQNFIEKYQLIIILVLIFFGWDIIIHPLMILLYKLIL